MSHVTISDYTPRESFTVGAGGSSGPFTLPAGFVVFTPSSDIKFYDDGVLLSYVDPPASTTQYSFSGTLIDGGYQGGTLTLGGKATSGSIMVAARDIPIERTTDFSYPSTTIDLEGLNTQLDKNFAILQDREASQSRALLQPLADAATIDYLPGTTARASKFLAFDGDGDPIASAAATSTGAVISVYAATLLDDAGSTQMHVTLDLEIGADIQAYSALLADLAAITPSTGDLLMGASSTGWTVVPKGTTGQFLTPTSTGLAYAAAVIAYTARAKSTVTTGFVANSVVSLTHGLGARAKGGHIFLECLVSTGTYTVGDQIKLDGYYDTALQGAFLVIDSDTVVKALLNASPITTSRIPTKGSTAAHTGADANWGVFIECWT